MSPRHAVVLHPVILVLAAITAGRSDAAKPFTLADEIGVGAFGDNSHTGQVAPISWSPNRQFVAVHVGRGIVETNKVESELRIYSEAEIRSYVHASQRAPRPKPLWDLVLATYKEGPIIRQIRWLPNSRGLAFLQTDEGGKKVLVYADLASHRLETLSMPGQDVSAFDLIDQTHFVYAVRDTGALTAMEDGDGPAVDETGRTFSEIALLGNRAALRISREDRSIVWAADGGTPQPFVLKGEKAPLTIFSEGLRTLRMSPDGSRFITALPVASVPPSWSKLYRPPTTGSLFRISPGPQDVTGIFGTILTSQYVTLDIAHATELFRSDGPTADSAGWFTGAAPEWSPDSTAVLLPGVFSAGESHRAVAPCVAVYRALNRQIECVIQLKIPTDSGLHQPFITSVRFEGTDSAVVIRSETGAKVSDELYTASGSGMWRDAGKVEGSPPSASATVWVRQRYDEPPVLLAGEPRQRARPLWDPNPQLRDIALGPVSILRWKDSTGRAWSGGLFEPPGFRNDRRYPLVIQTHDFDPSTFRPSGAYPTSYDARVLAASGIVVLETRCNVLRNTADEGPCQAPGYDAAVQILAREGIVDPDRVGIIGFSRTCYYTLEGLTRSRVHFAAASITDGINQGYWQYLMSVDEGNSVVGKLAEIANGAAPLGTGLKAWIKNAPTFHMDQVNTPLQIFGEGLESLISMWEPYAALRYQRKPVDLILLNTREHVLTTPAERLASQGGTVDWMRFWLQGYEDADPTKRRQYATWERLCDLQRAESRKWPTFCIPSKIH